MANYSYSKKRGASRWPTSFSYFSFHFLIPFCSNAVDRCQWEFISAATGNSLNVQDSCWLHGESDVLSKGNGGIVAFHVNLRLYSTPPQSLNVASTCITDHCKCTFLCLIPSTLNLQWASLFLIRNPWSNWHKWSVCQPRGSTGVVP